MPDVRLVQTPAFPLYDVLIDWNLLPDGTLDDTQALATAVIVALGTDALADVDEVLPDPDSSDRAGWWGDLDAQAVWGGWDIGCKLWLMRRAKIVGVEGWEGSTLVIESNVFNEETFLDSSGLPHSDELITTERIRKVGNQLEDVVTIHDPKLYTRDWQARFVYNQRNDIRIEDYSCNDATHRDISGVKGVNEARAARAQGRL